MALTKEIKKEIIKQNAPKEGDTGCPQVQISILSQEITRLNQHLKEHPKDFHSKRGLLMKNKKRKTMTKYLDNQKK